MHEADVGRAGSVYPGGRVTTVLGAWLGNLWKPQFEGKSCVYGQETHSDHPRPQDSDAQARKESNGAVLGLRGW